MYALLQTKPHHTKQKHTILHRVGNGLQINSRSIKILHKFFYLFLNKLITLLITQNSKPNN